MEWDKLKVSHREVDVMNATVAVTTMVTHTVNQIIQNSLFLCFNWKKRNCFLGPSGPDPLRSSSSGLNPQSQTSSGIPSISYDAYGRQIPTPPIGGGGYNSQGKIIEMCKYFMTLRCLDSSATYLAIYCDKVN